MATDNADEFQRAFDEFVARLSDALANPSGDKLAAILADPRFFEVAGYRRKRIVDALQRWVEWCEALEWLREDVQGAIAVSEETKRLEERRNGRGA